MYMDGYVCMNRHATYMYTYIFSMCMIPYWSTQRI